MSWQRPRHFNAPYEKPQDIPPQKLHNGALGPNFNNFSKPTNLSNSAVLRMLQEQEDDQIISGSVKKEVIWPPPPPEDSEYDDTPDGQNRVQSPELYSSKKPYKPFEPPPTIITLRKSPPLSQDFTPVYRSQPATDTIKGGFRMRGDQKWPPPEYKAQAEAENQARLDLARGPAFRPPKPKKDYTGFFAKNALPNTYPGYKAPPGTQHYFEPPVSQY